MPQVGKPESPSPSPSVLLVRVDEKAKPRVIISLGVEEPNASRFERGLTGLTRLQDFAERFSKTAPSNPVHPDNHVPDLSAGTGVRLPDSEEDYYRATKAIPVPT